MTIKTFLAKIKQANYKAKVHMPDTRQEYYEVSRAKGSCYVPRRYIIDHDWKQIIKEISETIDYLNNPNKIVGGKL